MPAPMVNVPLCQFTFAANDPLLRDTPKTPTRLSFRGARGAGQSSRPHAASIQLSQCLPDLCVKIRRNI
jgi:hypothetical protein